MTEPEWLECSNLRQMLSFVRPQATFTKMLDFACAIDRLMPRGSEPEQRQEAFLGQTAVSPGPGPIACDWDHDYLIDSLLGEILRRARQGDDLLPGRQRELVRASCELLRDIFAPFHSVILIPYWLAANDTAVRKLAYFIHARQAFDQLPILADALEEAGCTEQAILDHLRSPGPHVRGCWAFDLCLALPLP
jgi:hypothetical protein